MIYKLLLFNLVFFLALSSVQADTISVSQSLEKPSIPFEDSTAFTITVQWNGPQWGYLFTKPLDPQFEHLKIKSFASSIKSTGSGATEVTTKTYTYILIPTAPGTARIEPISISYISMPDSTAGELVTEAMTIHVAEPLPKQDDTGAVPNWLIAVFAVVGVGIMGVVGVVIARRRKQSSAPKTKSPVEQLLDDLAVVKKESAGDMKKFQTGLYRLLSDFCINQYDINPDTLDDEALVEALGNTNLNIEDAQHISAWIIKARKDKFRPVNAAPGDAIRLEADVRSLFEKLL